MGLFSTGCKAVLCAFYEPNRDRKYCHQRRLETERCFRDLIILSTFTTFAKNWFCLLFANWLETDMLNFLAAKRATSTPLAEYRFYQKYCVTQCAHVSNYFCQVRPISAESLKNPPESICSYVAQYYINYIRRANAMSVIMPLLISTINLRTNNKSTSKYVVNIINLFQNNSIQAVTLRVVVVWQIS